MIRIFEPLCPGTDSVQNYSKIVSVMFSNVGWCLVMYDSISSPKKTEQKNYQQTTDLFFIYDFFHLFFVYVTQRPMHYYRTWIPRQKTNPKICGFLKRKFNRGISNRITRLFLLYVQFLMLKLETCVCTLVQYKQFREK